MPYDHSEVARQIAATREQALAMRIARGDAAADAATIYTRTPDAEWRAVVDEVRSKHLLAVPKTPLHEMTPGQPAGLDYTVVATDSSFVPPDKHRGSYCYLVNVGRVMVQYGDEPSAELDSTPTHSIDPLEEGEDWMVSGRVLQAECALQELTELHNWADRFHADLAFLDGSLMQLGLALSPSARVHTLIGKYSEQLAAFAEIGVPVVGYVSRPASQAVMYATRLFGCQEAQESGLGPKAGCNVRCARPECTGLWTLDDGGLFWEMLAVGERSPVFQTRTVFGVQQEKSDFWADMGFCYLRTPYEIARLEFPLWVETAGLLDRVQAIVLSQCALGEGYPRVLTLADSFAVLRAEDRESYFYLLERAGLIEAPSEKAQGKRTAGRVI